ncbi:Probable E3 ubiquitin-protein ligase RHG1A [Linum grandiflorum]
MPVFPPTIADEIRHHRRHHHRHHFNSAEADPNPQLSCTTAKKNKGASAAAAFRGLGCTAGAAKQVSVPAMIRSSAEWERKKVKVKKKKSKEVAATAVGEGGSSGNNNNADGGLNQSGGSCMVIQDVWCGPGIGFSPDAAVVDSVDCVVNRRSRIDVVERFNPRERDRERERERPCLSRRATVDPQAFSFWDADPAAFATLRDEPDMSGGSRYYRHLRRAPPDGLAEMLMLQNGMVMGGRLDRFNEWRLDIDSMSYEQLLELEDRIGYVSTGLKEDEIGHCIRKYKLSVLSKLPSHIQTSLDKKCSICQEDFEGGEDEVGKLECGHGFHIQCIKQWLAHKNNCPVCKTAPLPRS